MKSTLDLIIEQTRIEMMDSEYIEKMAISNSLDDFMDKTASLTEEVLLDRVDKNINFCDNLVNDYGHEEEWISNIAPHVYNKLR